MSVTFLLVGASGCGMARTRTRSGLERTKGGRDESDGDEDSDISVFSSLRGSWGIAFEWNKRNEN